MRTPHPRRARVTSSHLPDGAIWAGGATLGHPRSPFHNPHAVNGRCKTVCRGAWHDLDAAMRLYAEHLDARPHLVRRAAAEPTEARFACRCPLYEPCHVDLLLARVDQLRAAA